MSIRRSQPTQSGPDLEESLAALSVLEENLKKTDSITDKMAILLSTVFDARLGKLEENIKPMYNKTRNLTQISESMALLASVLFPGSLLEADIDCEQILMRRLLLWTGSRRILIQSRVRRLLFVLGKPKTAILLIRRPKQNIQEYLGSITRLQGSLNTLHRSNIRSADNVHSQMASHAVSISLTCSPNSLKLVLNSWTMSSGKPSQVTPKSSILDPTSFKVCAPYKGPKVEKQSCHSLLFRPNLHNFS